MTKRFYRNKGKKENIVISIAGAHGVGKTTLFNLLKKELQESNKFKFYPERYVKNPPFPFGSDDKQIGFRSEIHFLQQFIRRDQSVKKFDSMYNGRIIILDRTPICVLVYSKALRLRKKDYDLIYDTYNSVDWREDYVIYLTAEAYTIMKRIVQRGSLDKERQEWNEDKQDYLLYTLTYYKKLLLSNDNVIIVDTDRLSQEEVLKQIKDIISNLTGFSFKKLEKLPPTQKSILNFLK